MFKKLTIKAMFLLASLFVMSSAAQAAPMSGGFVVTGGVNPWLMTDTSVSIATSGTGLGLNYGTVASSFGDFTSLTVNPSFGQGFLDGFSDVQTVDGSVGSASFGSFSFAGTSISNLLFNVTSISSTAFTATTFTAIFHTMATAAGFDDTLIDFRFEASHNGVTGSYSLTTPVPGVPLPAAVWLFGSALVGLFGVSRRKSSAMAA